MVGNLYQHDITLYKAPASFTVMLNYKFVVLGIANPVPKSEVDNLARGIGARALSKIAFVFFGRPDLSLSRSIGGMNRKSALLNVTASKHAMNRGHYN